MIGEAAMAVGNVKWFDARKGYDFIQPEDGLKVVFVNLNTLKTRDSQN
jgi:cold shock CspA family protein